MNYFGFNRKPAKEGPQDDEEAKLNDKKEGKRLFKEKRKKMKFKIQ